MPTNRGRRPLHHSTTDEENMMTPEQVKQLITDSLKHELNSELSDHSLARLGIFTTENLTDHLLTQADFDEWRRLQKHADRYIQHVISQPNGASQLLEKYGLDLSNNPGGHPTPTVQTPRAS